MRLLSRARVSASWAFAAMLAPAVTAPPDALDFALRRAAYEQASGRTWSVIAQLEPLDARLAQGDGRAAFLLGHAYLESGGFVEFRRLAGRANPGGPFAAWLAERGDYAAADLGDSEATARLVRAHGTRDRKALADSLPDALRLNALERATRAMDGARWEDAAADYATAERSWLAERDALAGTLSRREFDTLWRAWEAGPVAGDALALDAAPLERRGDVLTRAAIDLRTGGATVPAAAKTGDATAQPAAYLPAPAPEDWRAVRTLALAAAATAFERDRARERLCVEDERLAAQRRYFEFGARNARAEIARLLERGERLDALERRVSDIANDLDSVRAHATRRLAARASRTRALAEAQQVWIGALRHFHVLGPARERPERLPPRIPGPDSITRAEDALARAVDTFARRMDAHAPDLIARSHGTVWRPLLLDRVRTQSADARGALARARALAATADAAVAALATSPEREQALADARTLGARADSLARDERALRERVAQRTLEQAIARLDRSREAIDYGLAAAAYAASLRGAAADSGARTVVRRPDESAPASQSGAAALPAEDPAIARWRAEAIARSEAFLARYGTSPARSALRFQLADLLLVDARRKFGESMAAFLEAQENGRGGVPLPVLEHARPLALYRAILADDPAFEHADAVRFNAGSILAEEGDPAAEADFRALLGEHAASPLAAEAALRLGDLRFAAGRHEEAIDAYARAQTGSDVTVRLVALYKTGWAQFDRARYGEAVDAFRSVLDLYESGGLPAGAVDVKKETEAFLIHTFARSGGAAAFAAYFDRVGERPYVPRLLMALGQHFRRFEMYGEAARADSLHLERRPLDADALVSAERMATTFGRATRNDRSLDTRARLAPRFAPGSAWAKAQSSDSVRAAGATFARSSWTAIALHHQRKAAKGGDRADWQKALANYRSLLAQWPDDAEAPSFALNAGEACAALGDDRGALDYYAQAAKTGRDSIPEIALGQRLALTDAAYERGRGSKTTGDDALAKDVLAAGDALLERFPQNARATHVRWRQGNLAFAHGWYERAATDFEGLATRDPAAPKAPQAAGLRAEALFRLERYEDAGLAFEAARMAAARAGDDSLAARASRALPVCAFRRAEASVKADSSAHSTHARLFADVADRWPRYEHAPIARYRAALAWRRAGDATASVSAMDALLATYPESELARDAQLGIAETWKQSRDSLKAADAYAAFARRFPKDEGAAEAQLGAADLYAAAGRNDRADTLRLAYVRAHPEDVATGMAILEDLAKRELAAAEGTPRPHLADYLKRAAVHPELASKPILAEVRYREAEALRAPYEAQRLTLPLAKSIAAKRAKLDALLAAYKKSVDFGVAEWAQASAYRIGEALVAFGTALETSERPAMLAGDDRRAYDEVLLKESQTFYDRGEGVWADLLAHAAKSESAERGEWLARSQEALWGRLGRRFLFKAEFDYPLVTAKPPAHPAPSAAVAEVRP